jgi:sugar phosphate isomerase/epimerase
MTYRRDEADRVQFIFSTGSLYTYGIDRCFDFASRAGFDGVELLVDQRWDTRQSSYIRALMDRCQLPVIAVHSPFMPIVPGWPSDEPGRIRETVKLAEALGAHIVVHHLPLRFGIFSWQAKAHRLLFPVPFWNIHADYRRWLVEEFATWQATTTLKLCIENMPAKRWAGRLWNWHVWNSAEEMERFPSQTMDTTHLGTWGLEPADVYTKIARHVRHVHLSNFDGEEHRRPELGRLHLDRLLRQLAADGYAGAICLEMDPSSLNAGSCDDDVVAALSTSLSTCRSWASAAIHS